MFHTFYVQIPRPARHDTDNLPILSVSWLRNRVFGPETLRDTHEAAHLSVSRLGNCIFGPETLRDTHEAAHLSVSRQAGMILCPRQQRGAPVTARKMTAGDTATGRGEHLLPKKGLQQKDYRKDNHRMCLWASTRISWTRNRCCDQFDGHKMRSDNTLHIPWPSLLRKLPPSFEPYLKNLWPYELHKGTNF